MLLLREPLQKLLEEIQPGDSFEVTVTEEHWDRARIMCASGRQSRFCPISQALMERFPTEEWATCYQSSIHNPDATFGAVFEHNGQGIACAFDFGASFRGGPVVFTRK